MLMNKMHVHKAISIGLIAALCLITLCGCGAENPSHQRLRDSNYLSSSYSQKNSVHSYELQISNKAISSSRSFTSVTGTVTNLSNQTVRFVEVKAAFKNSNGKTVDTDWTYAVGSEGLAPGESSKFEIMVDKDSSIKDCDVTIQDFDY